jgi:hypothetical protein
VLTELLGSRKVIKLKIEGCFIKYEDIDALVFKTLLQTCSEKVKVLDLSWSRLSAANLRCITDFEEKFNGKNEEIFRIIRKYVTDRMEAH